ncbi:MAG: GTPase HflX [Candidatus Omnitrophota bacterium]
MEKCLLVTIELDSEKDNWPRQDVAFELEELTRTANGQVVGNIFCVRGKPTPDIFIGKGKAQEIALFCEEEKVDTVILSHDISGTQQRNLEKVVNRKTIDRTQLILDIFSRHARSPEGNMQVELAQLEYLLPRLHGKGVMLSRLGGGIGTRGPGEQKLEVDRRRIREKIFKLKQDLKHLAGHRKLLRKKRKEDAFCVTLVGYTNAGKSTLLNAITGAEQYVKNSLFTTLDPLSRRMDLPTGGRVIFSDTVGFLHRLPHHLIEAFHATLEEVVEADLLIHVLDASHPRIQEHSKAVFDVLTQLGCESKPSIIALNKIDLLEDKVWMGWLKDKFSNSVCISAKNRRNLEQLLKKVEDFFKPEMVEVLLSVPLNKMDIVDFLYRQAKVKTAEYKAKTVELDIHITKHMLDNILKNEGVIIVCVLSHGGQGRESRTAL